MSSFKSELLPKLYAAQLSEAINLLADSNLSYQAIAEMIETRRTQLYIIEKLINPRPIQ